MAKQLKADFLFAASLSSAFVDGLRLLYRSSRFAADAGLHARDFAVEIRQLLSLGLSTCDLRWLLSKGFAEHLLDTTLDGEPRRSIRPIAGSHFTEQSCLALTSAGVQLANEAEQQNDNGSQTASNGSTKTKQPSSKRETWKKRGRASSISKTTTLNRRSNGKNRG